MVRLTSAVLREDDLQGLGHRLIRLANNQGRHKIGLDCRHVECVTASGLAALVTLHKEVRATGVRLALRNVGESAYETFAVTGLTKVLDVRRCRGA